MSAKAAGGKGGWEPERKGVGDGRREDEKRDYQGADSDPLAPPRHVL